MDRIELLKKACLELKEKTANETDLIANLSNASAILNENMEDINWVGFYVLKNNELVLAPFQGKAACVRIPIGKGVCGTAFLKNEAVIVDDVHKFSGHIACDNASNSEIVLPIRQNYKAVAVLDIDSPLFSRFDLEEKNILETFVKTLEVS
ncbi:MAG: GAF domain-containing protein, partial [Oscillospiraceae bacterium]